MLSNCSAEKTLESSLNWKEIKPVYYKGNHSWIFIGTCDLKLKLQCFGHLMQRANSLEKTLMLGKIEGKRRRGWQRLRWLDSIIDSVGMNLSKLWEIVNIKVWKILIEINPFLRGVWGSMKTCVCMAESFCSTSETFTTSLPAYTPIQNRKLKQSTPSCVKGCRAGLEARFSDSQFWLSRSVWAHWCTRQRFLKHLLRA